MRPRLRLLLFVTGTVLCCLCAMGLAPAQGPSARPGGQSAPVYILGPDDQVVIHVLDTDEIGSTPYRIDQRGFLNVPLAGRVHAAGLTVEQLEDKLADCLKTYLRDPSVTVFVSSFRSQPVSVLGAVNNPGVVQIRGRKTLFEVLSLAGGLKQDAGNSINITRRKDQGPIPLPDARLDPTAQFYVAEVDVKSIMDAKNPQENIVVQPEDVISVPRAELVYVIGAVHRAGGFVLNERETVSVLQALSMAEGLDHTAASGSAKILRQVGNGTLREEIPVDLKKILAGKSADLPLIANDILFVPNSAAKSATLRGLEAALQIGVGVAIWRP